MRLALVNDQPLFARGLELLLPAVTDSRVTVVAVTDDGSLASGIVRRYRPSVVVVDLAIAHPGGLRTIAAIRRAEPDVPVIAMSDGRADEGGTANADGPPPDERSTEAIDALRAGAIGYLCKTTEPEDMIPPLLAAVDGWAVVPREVIAVLLRERVERNPSPVLTAEDRRLWRAIARGASVEHIAKELHVSERTAKRLTAALLRRLNVKSRIEAAALAGSTGLLEK